MDGGILATTLRYYANVRVEKLKIKLINCRCWTKILLIKLVKNSPEMLPGLKT
jgi:hypothetical protein